MLHPLDWDDEEAATKKHDVATGQQPDAPPVLQGFTPRIMIKGLPVIGIHGDEEEPAADGSRRAPIAIRKLHLASPPPLYDETEQGGSEEIEAIEEFAAGEAIAAIEQMALQEELEPTSWDDMTEPCRSEEVSEVIRREARALANGEQSDEASAVVLTAVEDEEPDTNRVDEPFCAKETMEMPRVEATELALGDIRATMQMARVTLSSETRDEAAFALTKRAPVLDVLDAAEALDDGLQDGEPALSEDSLEIDVDLETSDVFSVAGLMPSSTSTPSETGGDVAIDDSESSDGPVERNPARSLISSLPPMTLTPTTEPARSESRWNKVAGISSALVLVAMAAALVVSLMPSTGGLRVELASDSGVAPAKAEIFVDGQKKCDTDPCIIEDLSPGARTIKVLVPGVSTPATAIAIVNAGKTMPVKVTVQAAQPEAEAEPAKPAEAKPAESKTDEPKADEKKSSSDSAKNAAPKKAAVAQRPARRVSKPAPPVAPAAEEIDVSGDDIYAD